MPGRKWTAEEDSIVEEEYLSSSIEDLAKKLDRTIASVKKRAHSKEIIKTVPWWSPEEDIILRNHYTNYSFKQLEELLPGRTHAAILTRACKLNLCDNYKAKERRLTSTTIRCTGCDKDLPFDQFWYSGKGFMQLSSQCLICQQKSRRQRDYNLSPEDFENLLVKQNYMCAIESCTDTKLYIDHCHKTNMIRGLLCNKHNTGLGVFGDTAEGMKKGLAYLEEFENG